MAKFTPKFEYEHPTLGTVTIPLDLPPEGDPIGEANKGVGSTTRSSAGKSQTQFNYIDVGNNFKLVFLTKVQIDALRIMFQTVGARGLSFKYFESSDEIEFVIVYLDRKDFNPVRIVRSGADYIYDLPMKLRDKI